MYICICICICMYVCICICIYIYIYIYIYRTGKCGGSASAGSLFLSRGEPPPEVNAHANERRANLVCNSGIMCIYIYICRERERKRERERERERALSFQGRVSPRAREVLTSLDPGCLINRVDSYQVDYICIYIYIYIHIIIHTHTYIHT